MIGKTKEITINIPETLQANLTNNNLVGNLFETGPRNELPVTAYIKTNI